MANDLNALDDTLDSSTLVRTQLDSYDGPALPLKLVVKSISSRSLA